MLNSIKPLSTVLFKKHNITKKKTNIYIIQTDLLKVIFDACQLANSERKNLMISDVLWMESN